LRLRPEVARSFGFAVPEYPAYRKAKAAFERAEAAKEKALGLMKTRAAESFPGAHVSKIAEWGLVHQEALRVAREEIERYRSRLEPGADERFDRRSCRFLLKRLIRESLERESYNLRDALALLYNRLRDIPRQNGPLNTLNVRFVNSVCRDFVNKADPDQLSRFDLDRPLSLDRLPRGAQEWRCLLGNREARYATLLQETADNGKGGEHWIDPLLLAALVKQESSFKAKSVSPMGAAGLTQIMPQTAEALGMKNVYRAEYLEDAVKHLREARRLKGRAMALFSEIGPENSEAHASKSRNMMQKALEHRGRWEKLSRRYRRELQEEMSDDRLDARLALRYGYRYLTRMMHRHGGDISLALSAYNAGPTQVRRYAGIPPFRETVQFRNRVLRYYRSYLERIEACFPKGAPPKDIIRGRVEKDGAECLEAERSGGNQAVETGKGPGCL